MDAYRSNPRSASCARTDRSPAAERPVRPLAALLSEISRPRPFLNDIGRMMKRPQRCLFARASLAALVPRQRHTDLLERGMPTRAPPGSTTGGSEDVAQQAADTDSAWQKGGDPARRLSRRPLNRPL